jgi:hypothetical protein
MPITAANYCTEVTNIDSGARAQISGLRFRKYIVLEIIYLLLILFISKSRIINPSQVFRTI